MHCTSFAPSHSQEGDRVLIRGDFGNELGHDGAVNELFGNVGIDPTQKRILILKSTNHFMAAFGPIAKKVLYVDSDAPLARDYRRVPYRRVARPIWPLDAVTHPGLIY